MSNQAAIDTALWKAKKLGIPEKDLKKALLLIREFRENLIRYNLDPRAGRIALIFGDQCDYYWASQKLDFKQLSILRDIASDLFLGTRRKT